MTRSAEEMARIVDEVLRAKPHVAHGLKAVSAGNGEATFEFDAGPASFGPNGSVHGGVLAMLIEPAAVCAVLSQLPDGRHAVTVDMHVQHMRPVRPGARVVIFARVLRLGTSLAFCEATASDGDRVCTVARLTKSIVATPAPDDRRG